MCKADAIIGTNSSNIVSSKLADVVQNPKRLMNIHFFNPALVMQLVELVKGPHTAGRDSGIRKGVRSFYRKNAYYNPQRDPRLCSEPDQCSSGK